MRNLLTILFFALSSSFYAQERDTTKVVELKADIKLYKTFTTQKDTVYIDTSLTIQDEYKYNYLRKDNFGLFSFSNEGYLYNQLDFSKKVTPMGVECEVNVIAGGVVVLQKCSGPRKFGS